MKLYNPKYYSGMPEDVKPNDYVRIKWNDGIATGPHKANEIGWNRCDVKEYEKV